jgi:hypothetical protein
LLGGIVPQRPGGGAGGGCRDAVAGSILVWPAREGTSPALLEPANLRGGDPFRELLDGLGEFF